MLSRRFLLGVAPVLIAAPSIVRASNLMPLGNIRQAEGHVSKITIPNDGTPLVVTIKLDCDGYVIMPDRVVLVRAGEYSPEQFNEACRTASTVAAGVRHAI